MNITEVNIILKDEGKLKGFANIVLEDLFLVRGLKIIRGMNKYFIAMPSRKQKNGDFIDIAHPIKHDFRKKMEKIVLNKYWEKVKQIQRKNNTTSELKIRREELGIEYK